ncbi:Cytochrome c oxidase subunit 4 [Clydaea vesicula]|uniref:Cytochrome c oxidase subunit 4 n=1 Tax=Clydaea vesicula TaxID=447962 RepID=A0AAD5UAY5_9FUNG|nr:Cytochrome c oxidase subunit 4 [Clydaea vesicula]
MSFLTRSSFASIRRLSTNSILRASAGKKGTVEPEIPGFRAPGEIPTNYELATGTERYEYFKKLEGEDPWADLKPIHLSVKPTKHNPVIIKGIDPVRYIGCTGFPADSHEGVWLTIHPSRIERCPHCGNAFKYELEHDH